METYLPVIFIMGGLLSVEGILEKCDRKIDLAVVLDASASIGEDNFNLEKQFAKELLKRFSLNKDKTRVSLVTYSQYVNIKPRFKDFYDQKEIEETLDNTLYEGSATKTAKALTVLNFEVFAEKSGARLSRPDVKDAVVIVSDGFSSIGIEGIKEKTDIAKHVGIQIYAVGITSKVKKAELRIMASQPIGRHFFTLKHSPNIKSIVDRIVKDLCKHF